MEVKVHPEVKLRLEPGVRITCPECGDLIGIVSDPILKGAVMYVENLALHQKGQENHRTMTCLECGTAFGRNVIHTSDGWR